MKKQFTVLSILTLACILTFTNPVYASQHDTTSITNLTAQVIEGAIPEVAEINIPQVTVATDVFTCPQGHENCNNLHTNTNCPLGHANCDNSHSENHKGLHQGQGNGRKQHSGENSANRNHPQCAFPSN